MTTFLTFFLITTFVLTCILAISEAAREAKEHHTRNVAEQLIDFIKNRSFSLPSVLQRRYDADYTVDKHFIYDVSRFTFFVLVLSTSFYLIPYHSIIYGIIHFFSLILLFRGIHDSYYYKYRFFLDNTIMKYSKGFWSEGDKKDSGIIDSIFGNSLLQRMICIILAVCGEFYLFISI